MSNKLPMGASLDGGQQEKVALAKRISHLIRQNVSDEERRVAEDIARVLVRDISVSVRSALAFELRQARTLSSDISHKIAMDVEDVAGPFLEATLALSDDELAALVPKVQEFARISIARRPVVSGKLGAVIVEFATEPTVSVLLQNPGAQLNKDLCKGVISKFPKAHPVLDKLASRVDVPLGVVEDLIQLVSEKYALVLTKRYKLAKEVAKDLSQTAQSAAVGDILESKDPVQVTTFIKKLKASGRLTPEIIISNLRNGNKVFFTTALAVLIGKAPMYVERMIEEGSEMAIGPLLNRAKISNAYLKRFKNAFWIAYGQKD